MQWDSQRLSGQHSTMQLIWEVIDKKYIVRLMYTQRE